MPKEGVENQTSSDLVFDRWFWTIHWCGGLALDILAHLLGKGDLQNVQKNTEPQEVWLDV